MTDTERPAVLFDIDGTLVDSNYLHIESWERALAALGHPVDSWRIHRAIGMDSSKLLDELLGDEADELGEEATERHSAEYKEMIGRLRPFAGARDLLAELHRRGLTVVLATSAPDDELEILRDVLEVEESVAAITSAGDVGTAKPDPDIIEVALQKAGVPPERAIMVGDAVWDMQAAGRAGVTGIGVLSGGISEDELRRAGAVEVYLDVADLLDRLDDSRISALLSE
jgi:HAD superfamily hydrolase (TIGR01509 family)